MVRSGLFVVSALTACRVARIGLGAAHVCESGGVCVITIAREKGFRCLQLLIRFSFVCDQRVEPLEGCHNLINVGILIDADKGEKGQSRLRIKTKV